jgi:hypothetical protein
VWESFKKYAYLSANKFKKIKQLSFADGIQGIKSAKKHLGDDLKCPFIIIRSSISYPGKQKDFQNLHINIAIAKEVGPVESSLHHSVPLRVSSVLDVLPYEARVAIISNLAEESSFVGAGIGYLLPAKYLRYNAIPGSDLGTATKKEVAEMRTDEAVLTTGWLYGRKPIEYTPEKLANAVFFFEGEDKLNTDCLVHAVNYALRFPFFV